MGVCESCNIDDILFKIFLWLGYTSSILNPIIYTVFNRTFKITFIRILKCNGRFSGHFCRCRNPCRGQHCLRSHKAGVLNNGTAIRIRVDDTHSNGNNTYDESLV